MEPEVVEEPRPRNMGIEKLKQRFNMAAQRPMEAKPQPKANTKRPVSDRNMLYDDEMEKKAKSILNTPAEEEFDSIFRGDRVNLSDRVNRKEPDSKESSDGLLLDSYLKINKSKYE